MASILRVRVLYRACEAAGLPCNEWLRWHELRHAFATNYLNAQGSDFKRVMNLMGHKDMRTTLIYDHVIDDSDRDDNDRMVLKKSMPFDLGDGAHEDPSNVVPFKKAS